MIHPIHPTYRNNSKYLPIVFCFAALLLSLSAIACAEIRTDAVTLPEGFSISVYTDQIPGARQMALSRDGVLFVGTREEGVVYAVTDNNRDRQADEVLIIVRGLHSPNGVALYQGDLYVAEISRIIRFPDIMENFRNNPAYEVVYDRFPDDTHHGWKYIKFSPDGWLYVPVGAPCNVCEEEDPVYATITRMRPDGTNFMIYASGIRNSVGFDFHPRSGLLWFTNNGRDWLGDNQPPDTLHHAPAPGLHFGFPYCHAGTIPDPDYGGMRPCSEFSPPAETLGPHVAALGMIFYTGQNFPEEYKGDILIAEHGSWNRSIPIGYRITRIRMENGQPAGYFPFADGWLEGRTYRGRPVDIVQMPDGSILISDDHQGAIYRVWHQ